MSQIDDARLDALLRLTDENERLSRLVQELGAIPTTVHIDANQRTMQLEAEVERLRAEKAAMLAAENASVLQHQQDWDRIEAKVAKLEAENAELRARPKPSQRAVDMLATAKVAAERETLFHANAALKARLAWFEQREPWIRKHVDHCWFEMGASVQDWETENPKPSEGT
jgi:DNA gyrase/topoisomerase IV subunit A